jgi:XapX domain-containing protein
MKTLLISFAAGLIVGVAYGVIRVKSPAPPIVALIGLLGMVVGEPFGGWFITRMTRKVQPSGVATTRIAGERKGESVIAAVHSPD